MKHWIAKQYLNYFASDERPLPGWVERAIQGNPEIKRVADFHASLRQRLRDEAPQWAPAEEERPTFASADARQTNASQTVSHRRATTSTRTAQVVLGFACLLIAVGLLTSFRSTDPAPPTTLDLQRESLKPVLASVNATSQVAQQIGTGTHKLIQRVAQNDNLALLGNSVAATQQARQRFGSASRNVGAALQRLGGTFLPGRNHGETAEQSSPLGVGQSPELQ